MFDRRTQACVKSLNVLRKTYQDNLWKFALPVDTKFRDASQAGVVPSKLDAQTHGVRAYRHLLDDLLERTSTLKERQHG